MPLDTIRSLVNQIQLKQVQAFDEKLAEEKTARRKLRGEHEKDISEILAAMTNPEEPAEQTEPAEEKHERPKESVAATGDIPPPPITNG